MIVIDIFNFINSILPESTILAATIFSGMGSGTQSGKLGFKKIYSSGYTALYEDSKSIKIYDLSNPINIAVEDKRIAIGSYVCGVTSSIFSVNTDWNSISKPDSYEGLILSSSYKIKRCLNGKSLIIGGFCQYTGGGVLVGCQSTIIGGLNNYIYQSYSTIIGGSNNCICGFFKNSPGRVSSIIGSYASRVGISNLVPTSNLPDTTIVSSRGLINYSVKNNSIIGSCGSLLTTKGSSIISSIGSIGYQYPGYFAGKLKFIDCANSYSSIISSSAELSSKIINKTTSDNGYNSIIASSNYFIGSCNLKNSSIISSRSDLCDSETSSVIGSLYGKIQSGTSSTIIGGYCNKICNSKYSSIFGGCNNAICNSVYSSIFQSEPTNLIKDSCNSSIMVGEKSIVCNSCFSTIFCSCYGLIYDSKFSTLITKTKASKGHLCESCNSFLMNGINYYSRIICSDNSMMITTNSENYLLHTSGSVIIGQKDNRITGEARVKNTLIIGSEDSFICGNNSYNSNMILSNNNGTIFFSNNSGILGSDITGITSSSNSTIIGSCESKIISSTNSNIIASNGVTMSGSINSSIIASLPGKTLYNATNTTRTGHIQINGSASIFDSGNVCNSISCVFSCATITCIVVCHGFIVRLQ